MLCHVNDDDDDFLTIIIIITIIIILAKSYHFTEIFSRRYDPINKLCYYISLAT